MPLPNSNNSNNKKGPIRFSMYWMYALVLVFIAGVYFMDDSRWICKCINCIYWTKLWS